MFPDYPVEALRRDAQVRGYALESRPRGEQWAGELWSRPHTPVGVVGLGGSVLLTELGPTEQEAAAKVYGTFLANEEGMPS